MGKGEHVVIIGGGISGVASAYELANSGYQVTVLERGELASMGSGRSLAGVRQSGRHPAEMPLARAAVRRWMQLGDELESDLEYRQGGNLRLAEDDSDALFLETMVADQRELGLDITFLSSHAEVKDVAPVLSDRIVAAAYTPSDGHANPLLTVQAYAAAARNLGARILEQSEVRSIDVDAGRVAGVTTTEATIPADHVVIAAGIDSPRLLRPLGIHLPLTFSMVPVMQTVPCEPVLNQVLGTAKAHFAARQEVSGALRFSSGGRQIDLPVDRVNRFSMQPEISRVVETLERASSIISGLPGTALNAVWGGLIDMTADGIPVLSGVDELPGLTIAAGFCGHGFCLGPVTGEIVRDLVAGREPEHPIAPFRFDRLSATPLSAGVAELLG